MRRLAAVPALAILAVPAGAPAAQVQTDRACYLQTARTTVTVTGTGFSPGKPFVVALDGTALDGGQGSIDGLGAMRGAFNPPMLRPWQKQRRFDVSVSAADVTATTSFTLTQFVAGFSPATGDPSRLRVRFSVHGFGLATHNPDVYLHYVDPLGRMRKTIRLGRAQGQCGAIERTAKRRLFPFAQPRGGRWRLQFDTSRAYHRGTKGSDFLFFTVGVTVRHRLPAGASGTAGSLGAQVG
jgi:hypothetical protein